MRGGKRKKKKRNKLKGNNRDVFIRRDLREKWINANQILFRNRSSDRRKMKDKCSRRQHGRRRKDDKK